MPQSMSRRAVDTEQLLARWRSAVLSNPQGPESSNPRRHSPASAPEDIRQLFLNPSEFVVSPDACHAGRGA